MVLRHMRSVIAGCKAVLPRSLPRKPQPHEKISHSRAPHPSFVRPHPSYRRLMAEKGRMGRTLTSTPARALSWSATRVDTGRTSAVRVLVVEDEQLLADAVATGLRREAMAVDVVYDGAAALERIGVNDYDVVVLDRDLPLVHGDDVCRKIVELGMPTAC